MTDRRPEVLENAPLQYAPENELGVVFLFSHIARKLRVRVERIRPQFPDCIAYQKTSHGEKRIRIEFEYRSSSFKKHNHSSRKCDWIVCWEHDWPEVAKNLKVIELRNYFGLGFKVWIQPYNIKQLNGRSLDNKESWGVSRRASAGDLLLMYASRPKQCIEDIFLLTAKPKLGKAGWREGDCYWEVIKRVCKLKSPIFLDDLKQHKIIKTAGFIKAHLQGNSNATEYWPHLYTMIINRNPSIKKKLIKYAPERI